VLAQEATHQEMVARAAGGAQGQRAQEQELQAKETTVVTETSNNPQVLVVVAVLVLVVVAPVQILVAMVALVYNKLLQVQQFFVGVAVEEVRAVLLKALEALGAVVVQSVLLAQQTQVAVLTEAI
jgi:hypothetical protein